MLRRMTERTRSSPSKERERFWLRKLEMCACWKPVSWARRLPVSSSFLILVSRWRRRFSFRFLNFMGRGMAVSYSIKVYPQPVDKKGIDALCR